MISAKTQRRIFKLGDEIIHEGGPGDRIHIIRQGEASLELAGTSRTAVANPWSLRFRGMAFLGKGRTTAAVIARSEEVQTDESWRTI